MLVQKNLELLKGKIIQIGKGEKSRKSAKFVARNFL